MMRYVLILIMVLFVTPVMAQGVKGYSTSGGVSAQKDDEPEWVKEIDSRDDGGIRLKSGRLYKLNQNSVIESYTVPGGTKVEFVFDLDNGVVILKGTSTTRFSVFSFTDLAGGRANQVKEYGCYIGKNSRSSEAAYFVEKHCQ